MRDMSSAVGLAANQNTCYSCHGNDRIVMETRGTGTCHHWLGFSMALGCVIVDCCQIWPYHLALGYFSASCLYLSY